jgi:hypothetical protein
MNLFEWYGKRKIARRERTIDRMFRRDYMQMERDLQAVSGVHEVSRGPSPTKLSPEEINISIAKRAGRGF